MHLNTVTHLQCKVTCGKYQVGATEGMVHSWYGQKTSRDEMEFGPDTEENGQDFDRWRKREGGECCRQGGAQQEESTKHFPAYSKWTGLGG